MKNWLKNQFSGLGKIGTPGINPAGMSQTAFENVNDSLWDDILGPSMRIGAKVALLGGIGALGYNLATNPDSGSFGGTLGAGIIGAGLGTLSMSMVGRAAAGKVAGNTFGSTLKRFGYRFGSPAMGGIVGLAAGAAWGGLGGGLGLLAGIGVIAGGALLNSRGIDLSLPLRGAIRAIGGVGGLTGAAIQGARSVGGALWTGAKGIELTARALLTGGRGGVQGPLDSWFPFFRNTPVHSIEKDYLDKNVARKLISRGVPAREAIKSASIKAGTRIFDPRKIAPNPRITRRLVGMGALFAVGSAVHEAMQPQIAPPSLFFDGRNMRHVNDMGTGGDYGMGIMGRNSGLNINYQDAARTISNMF